MEAWERIRRAYFVEGMSIRAIAREFHHCRRVVRKAIRSPEPEGYTLRKGRESPVLGPYRARIDGLLEENERLPRKQRYTGRRIYEMLRSEGYTGSESTVRRYIARRWKEKRRPRVYIPLAFEPGAMEAARRAGITKRVTPHTLRYTFATRFLRRGGDLATLQAILSHANLATTARYLHPDAARVQEMVEEL